MGLFISSPFVQIPKTEAPSQFTWTEGDIAAWQPELKPLGIQTTPTLTEALNHYQTVTMATPIVCPLGQQVNLRLRHFFPLVCQGTEGQTKGWVATASSTEHALQLIAEGGVGFNDLAGCDLIRVRDLPLFNDVIRSPHVISQKVGNGFTKLLYLKRYEAKKPRIHIAVTFLLEDGQLVPASFYHKNLSVNWLNASASVILWQKKEG